MLVKKIPVGSQSHQPIPVGPFGGDRDPASRGKTPAPGYAMSCPSVLPCGPDVSGPVGAMKEQTKASGLPGVESGASKRTKGDSERTRRGGWDSMSKQARE